MCGLNRKLLPCLHFDNILESLIKVVLSKKVPFVHITGGKAVFRRLTGEKGGLMPIFFPIACAPFKLCLRNVGVIILSPQEASVYSQDESRTGLGKGKWP